METKSCNPQACPGEKGKQCGISGPVKWNLHVTLSRPGFFRHFALYNSATIKVITMALGVQIVRSKMFPLRCSTRSDDDILRGSYVMVAKCGHLGFLDFSKTSGKHQN